MNLSKSVAELQREHVVGRISGLLNFLLAYFSFLWKKELHVAAGDLSGTKDIA